MTSRAARYRYILFFIGAVAASACAGTGDSAPVSVVDLLDRFERAERRPAAGFELTTSVAAGIARPSLMAPVPGRAIWSLPMPARATLRTFLTLDPAAAPGTAVRFRVGVSDHRIYEAVAERTVEAAAGWTPLTADLSAYAGFKWSLFYRPDRTTWRLVLATEPAAGAATGIWGSPEIVTDRKSAMEYVRRRETRR